jgi:hypothetical protein
MGNALFVVLLSVDHETSNEFLGMFARKEDAFGFMEKCVKSAIRSNTFVLEDGRWTNGASSFEVYSVEVGVPFEKLENGWVRE